MLEATWPALAHEPCLSTLPACIQEGAPEELLSNSVFQRLREHVKTLTDQHHSVPRSSEETPKEWVRGWTDSGKDLSGSSASGASKS